MSALPLNLFTAAQVRAIDRYAIQAQGLPGYTLMCRAGAAAFDLLRYLWPAARHIVVLCGGGNNGGDGYVAARFAGVAGFQVEVLTFADPAGLRGDARRAWQECAAAGVPIRPFDRTRLAQADVLIDGIFGTGLDRPLEDAMRERIGQVNASGRPVLALDLPSGLNADSGEAMGAAIQAEATISFIGLKLGCFVAEGPKYAGRLHFSDLGVDATAAGIAPVSKRIDGGLLARCFPPRPRDSHKGDFGRVLIVGGGPAMAGAVRLCGEACLRSGAGLVTIATRPENVSAITAERPELICHGITSAAELAPLLDAANIVAIGPGLGRDAWAQSLFDRVLQADKPLVIDADGLNLLAQANSVGVARGDRVLTPHPGEAARLLKTDTQSVQADRLAALNALVERFGGIVVLKGSGTLVGARDRTPELCDRGNPGMATAGMGDVLTGVTAAALAQVSEPWDAVRAAVLAHAMAGDAAAQAGERGLIASDVIARLPECLNPHSN